MQTRKNEKLTSAKLESVKNSNSIKTHSSLEFKKKNVENTNVKKSNPQDELKQRHKSFVGSLTKKAPVKKYKKNLSFILYTFNADFVF